MIEMEAPPDDDAFFCARHPTVETRLRCGRCETPICPRCQVPTPVGARCRTCAGVKRVDLLVRPAELARAAIVGLMAAILGWVVLAYIPFLGVFGYAALGYGVGEVVSRGARGRRARELAIVAVACFLVGWLLGSPLPLLVESGGALLPSLPRILLGEVFSLSRNLFALAFLAVGGLLAWMRCR